MFGHVCMCLKAAMSVINPVSAKISSNLTNFSMFVLQCWRINKYLPPSIYANAPVPADGVNTAATDE